MADLFDLKIRHAGIDDLASIFHLGEKLFHSRTFSNLYRTWDEYEVTTLFNFESEHMIVAEAGGKVVGFALGTTIAKARSAWSYGHLLWLGIDPDYAGHGIGSILFERFRKIMAEEGIRMLLVDTQADNEAALRFFLKKGFSNPKQHVYMTLNLQSTQGDE